MKIALQRTLRTAVGCRGIALHCGQSIALTMRPAAPNSGIIFRRLDCGTDIRAQWRNTIDSALATVLSNGEGVRISTIEHLMAALAGSGVDNAIIELDGPEVPIMDGSSAPFLDLIGRAGTIEQDVSRRAIKVLKPVTVADNGASATLDPDHGFSMGFEIDFDNPLIRKQDMAVNFEPGTFETELSRARTFGLLDEVLRMRAAGFALGGSLDNAIVVSGGQVLNAGGLRYTDEFVRHKLLDAYGDLYLAGGPLIAQFRGVRSGHALTRKLLIALFADKNAWCETTLTESAPVPALAWAEPRRAARA